MQATPALKEAFHKWAESNYAETFFEQLEARIKEVTDLINALPNPFQNGRKGLPYTTSLKLPEDITSYRLHGLENLGLNSNQDTQGRTCTIQGTLLCDGEFQIFLECYYTGWLQGMPPICRSFPFLINPNPRELWKVIPVPADIEYPTPDSDCAYIRVDSAQGQPQKDVLAASRRGRSHEHAGKPRDDNFSLAHCPETNWYIAAVADGAGSAAFSREGSRLACASAVRFCKNMLAQVDNEIDQKITIVLKNALAQNVTVPQLKAMFNAENVGFFYDLLAGAAHQAYKDIKHEADSTKRPPNLYATTLLLLVGKRFQSGLWLLASFNIGDGAIGIIGKDPQRSWLFCTPDEGEYSGQTRFVTMQSIFSDYLSLKKRIQVTVVNDFTAALLMTDGVSDAKFETDANLNNPQKWAELWAELKTEVHLDAKDHKSQHELLEWLGFWSQGNHDDRTIVIIS